MDNLIAFVVRSTLLSVAGIALALPVHAQEATEKRYAPTPEYAENVYFGEAHSYPNVGRRGSLG
jgi:hypothetical protein